jgi:hypothetical protein
VLLVQLAQTSITIAEESGAVSFLAFTTHEGHLILEAHLTGFGRQVTYFVRRVITDVGWQAGLGTWYGRTLGISFRSGHLVSEQPLAPTDR